MQSKISCFNKTIFKKNLTRFWPFAVIYGVYLMMVHPMVAYLEISNNMQNVFCRRTVYSRLFSQLPFFEAG